VNALNKVGGFLLLAGLALAVIIGFQTPTGRQFWDGIWQAGAAVVGYVGDLAEQSTGIAGTPTAWIIAGAVFLIVVTLVARARGSRGAVLATALAAFLLGLFLYNPSLVSGIGG
jgi:hypothetical protein